jgi:hypothetical protein
MALEYIVDADIKQTLYRKTADIDVAKVQGYIDQANVEIEDVAIRKEVPIADIAVPIHSKLKLYAVNYCLRLFAADRIGLNVNASGKDVYKDLFDRSQYLINLHKPELNPAVLTQLNQNSQTRATRFGRTTRR